MLILLIGLILCQHISTISGSGGDQSSVYQKCLYSCIEDYCEGDGVSFKSTTALSKDQDIFCRILQWSCRDECSYQCMWGTVYWYSSSGHKPKFYGKWPFTRFLGIQEPASAFTSLLNLATNAYMYLKIRKEFPIRRSKPLVVFWHVFAFVCMNAWLWSTIFHMRDKPFTEFMDYACALSMVMALFVAAVVRVFHKQKKLAIILLIPLCYYFTHVQHLYTGRIDYNYNMKINIMIGALGTGLWLGWAFIQVYVGRRYALNMVWFTLGSAVTLTLELLDFPPIWGSWDAHAMWHLSTSPLPLLFYRFVIYDLRFLKSGHYERLIRSR